MITYSLVSEGGYAVVAAAAFEVQGETSQGEAKRIAAGSSAQNQQRNA
jgi:hypothetical protein